MAPPALRIPARAGWVSWGREAPSQRWVPTWTPSPVLTVGGQRFPEVGEELWGWGWAVHGRPELTGGALITRGSDRTHGGQLSHSSSLVFSDGEIIYIIFKLHGEVLKLQETPQFLKTITVTKTTKIQGLLTNLG